MMNFNKKMLVKEASFYINKAVTDNNDTVYVRACVLKSLLLNCLSIHHLKSDEKTVNEIKKWVASATVNKQVTQADIDFILWMLQTSSGYYSEWVAQKESVEKHVLYLEKMESEMEI